MNAQYKNQPKWKINPPKNHDVVWDFKIHQAWSMKQKFGTKIMLVAGVSIIN